MKSPTPFWLSLLVLSVAACEPPPSTEPPPTAPIAPPPPAATAAAPRAPMTPEERARDLVARMTLEEKIDYIGGDRGIYIRAVPRLGLPEIKMSDGPQGCRHWGPSTAYPA